VGLAGLALALLTSRSLGVRAEVIEPTVQVRLDAAYSRIDVGDLLTLTVRAGDLDQLYGFQWKLRFNPTVVQVVDQDAEVDGVQIIPSLVFAGKNTITAANVADNALGEITYGETLFLETHGVDGEAVLGRIVFRAVAEGVSALRFGTGGGQSRITCLRERSGSPTPVEVPVTWLKGRINIGDYVLYLPAVYPRILAH
jgi:hypothetical protein